eukprot:g4541.t1
MAKVVPAESNRMMKKSRVLQVTISSVNQAQEMFARHESSFGGTPIVLVPNEPRCFGCCLTIPDGFWVLCQKWYEDKGAHPAGGISYNHPVFNCPTEDNVMVEVDVSLTFQIGPTVEDAKKFVYYLGAHRFDELLSTETEEAIRALVNDVPVMKVHDLREEFAGDMRDNLNKTMRAYGVEIRAVKVTDVKLPTSLEITLQRRTSYETEIEQEEKRHVAEIRKLNDDAQQIIEEIQKTNQRKVQELEAKIERAILSREEQVIGAKTDMNVATVNANAKRDILCLEATSKKQVAAIDGERKYVELTIKAASSSESRKVCADQDFASRVVRAKAKHGIKVKEAECIRIDGNVEDVAGTELQAKRNFEVSALRMGVLTGIAQHSRMVIAGDAGERLLQQFAPGSNHDLSSRMLKTFDTDSAVVRGVPVPHSNRRL